MKLFQKLCFTVLLLSYIQSKAQVQIINSETLEGISYVELYSTHGDLIGIANVDGFLDKITIDIVKKSESLIFILHHLTFNELSVKKEKLISENKIKLKPSVFNLNEVTITSRKRQSKYIRLKGFFRSYQMNNDNLKYYMDGVVEYYIPLSSKDKIWNTIIYNRSFVNEKLEKQQTSSVILMVGPPQPDKRITLNEIKKNYQIQFLDSLNYNIIKNNKIKGKIKRNLNYSTLQIELISKDNPKEYKMLGNHSIIEYHNGFVYFNSKSLDSLSMNDLMYHKEIRKLRFKRKKDENFENIEGIHEFFVSEIEPIPDLKNIKTSKDFSFIRESNYKTNFWDEFSNHPLYKPLPESLIRTIKDSLTKLKNNND